jgi:CubicO group peptidase (beta-lactamase class C family)
MEHRIPSAAHLCVAASMFLMTCGVSPGPVNVTGAPAPRYAAVDRAVETFMRAQSIRNAEFAMSERGTIVLSHAYTYGAGTTIPATIFRLASNSKAWTSAALYTLFHRGRISRNTLAFKYLGITRPLPVNAQVDPRVFRITVGNLIDHKSGWDDTKPPYFDPTHAMRRIALVLHMSKAIDETTMVRYQMAQKLQESPGQTYAYCNVCYDILAMIVAKAAHTGYQEYVVRNVAAPMHVTNLKASPTLEPRLPGEVRHYYSLYSGVSAIYVRSNNKVPDPNGGDSLIRFVDLGAGGWATNAESELALMDRYLIWGVGPVRRGADSAREGSDEGTNTWAEQRADNKHWAFLINTRNYKNKNAFETFAALIDKVLNGVP